MTAKKLATAIVGFGLIGSRRAKYAAEHPVTQVALVIDTDVEKAKSAAETYQCDWGTNWEDLSKRSDIDIVVVSTTNHLLLPIAKCALTSGKHVLIEKPMGRNLNEALQMADISQITGKSLKIGFNHRYHPGIHKAYQMYQAGAVGNLMYIISRYGHGGRPGYDQEWRGNPELAGGGELLDQGVHLADLVNWFIGPVQQVIGLTERFFWQIAPLEDNGMAILKNAAGKTAMFHTSWTQWKNLFQFEIFGEAGYLAVNGLGGSYGIETLTWGKRNPIGGPPIIENFSYEGPDDSWRLEWEEWINHILNGTSYWGTPTDGVNAMKIIDGIYQSSKKTNPVIIN